MFRVKTNDVIVHIFDKIKVLRYRREEGIDLFELKVI